MSGQDPRWGVILRAGVAVPIYHVWGRTERLGDIVAVYTRCGRAVSFNGLTSVLQIIHLKMFAKRCKGCFPR